MNYMDQPGFVPVPNDEPVRGGDIIIYQFKVIPGWLFVKQAGIAKIESELNKRQDIRRWSANYEDFEKGYVYYKLWIRDVYPIDFEGPIQEDSVFAEPTVYKAGTIGTIATLAAVVIGAASVIYFSYSLVRAAKFNAVASGNVTPEQIIEMEQSGSLGSQIQKAGIGIMLPLAAVAAIIYFKKR